MKKKQFKPKNDMFIYMLAALIFIVPLIVFLKVDTLPKDMVEIIGSETYPDLFAYYKAYILQIGALIMFILAIGYRFYYEKSFRPDVFTWLLMAFAASILLSYVFSEHKEVALRGAFERYEGTLTWLSYVALSYSVYTLVEKKRDAYILIGAFVMSSALVSLIGAFQYFGMDFFRTDLGKKLMLGGYYEQLATSVDFKMEKGRVYSTLYNPNYVGSMIALAFPLTVYLMDELRKRWFFILGSFIIVLQMISLVGSRSAGGFFGVSFSIGLMAIYFAWKHPKRKMMIPVVCVLLLIGAVGAYQVPYVKANLSKVFTGIGTYTEENFPVKDIQVEGKALKYVLQDDTWFKLLPEMNDVLVETQENVVVEKSTLESDMGIKNISHFKYDLYWVTVEYFPLMRKLNTYVYEPNQTHWKAISNDMYYDDNFSMQLIPITEENIKANTIPLIKNEKAFSNRGYIWNRTLSAIVSKPIFGYGTDTFVLNFPQVDLLSKNRTFDLYNVIVDKPHNIYMQLAINFGLVGLLLFLGLILKSIWRKNGPLVSIGLLSYIFVGTVNDSVVYTTMMIFIIISLCNLKAEVK